jgi:glycine/D-amino acid oxidase-like deaminating enzyme
LVLQTTNNEKRVTCFFHFILYLMSAVQMSKLQADKRPSGVKATVAVIGAGIAGCALAYELSKYGCDVTLIDAKEVGSGASSVPLALLNPHRGRTARATELDKAGLKSMWELKQELEGLGFDSGLYQTGVLRIASSERQAKLWRKLEDVKWLEPSQIPKVYHAPFGALLVEDGGYIQPSTLLNALVSVAKQRGVNVLENHEIEKVNKRQRANDFELFPFLLSPFSFPVVFLCPGASTTFTANLGLEYLELEYQAGDVIALESTIALPQPIAGAIYGGSREGVVYMGGNHRDEDDEDVYHLEQLQKSSSWFIPALKDAKRIFNWSGVRAKQESNEPLVKELEPNLYYFGAFGGRGFLCAYHLAKQLVGQVAQSHKLVSTENAMSGEAKKFPLLEGEG